MQAEREEKKGAAKLAQELLDSCAFDLDILESQLAMEKPANNWKQARLEMLFDLLRGYALAAILALLVIKLPWFRKRREKYSARWGAAILLMLTAVIFGWTDAVRYGTAAWSYFDIQVVFTACTGLLGGLLPGVFAAGILAALRLLLQPDIASNGSLGLFGAAIIGALFFWTIKKSEKKLFFPALAGMLAGILHSFCVYFPLRNSLPFGYLISASCFVTISEAFGIFLFFAVIDGLLHEEKQEVIKNELVRSQLMFLQAQIKPHFLFNALNTIAAVCGSENAQKSKMLIGHLADFFRHALETKDPVLALEKELEFVDAYLELEKARFGSEIEIVRDIRLSEKARNLPIPILIIQPVVENAIRHGLRKKTGPGLLKICAFEDSTEIFIQITDNGAGNSPDFFDNYLKKNIGKAEGHGIGLRNIDERLRRFFGKGDWVKFESHPERGTSVTIKIPSGQRKK